MAEDKEAYLRNVLSQITDKSKPALQRSLTQIEHPGFRDACKQRQVPSVPEPAWHKPRDEQFFTTDSFGNRRPNTEFLKNHFLREGRVTEEQALYLLQEGKTLLEKEQNLLSVQGPITVCGDIHGQFYDLMKIFEIGGDVAHNTYLFLGDYVDRGCFGIECLLYLYSLKICYPNQLFLIRGNHECRHLTEYFTFHRECTRKYSMNIYMACIDSFTALPLAAVLDRRFLCVHGGISPELNSLADINRVNRFIEPPSHGLLCDLLWADPAPNFGNESDGAVNGVVPESFLPNPARGCSYFYTYEAVCNFLERNALLGIIRGHEVQQQGYQMYRKTRAKKFPSVITIFSAPNYCDFYHNRAAVLKYVDKNITIRQFNATGHPYWLPNFMDAFTWSLPFVGDKIVQMLLGVLSVCSAEELEEPSEDEDKAVALAEAAENEAAIQQRRAAIRNKILAVGRMRRIFQLLREEAETASEVNSAVEVSGPAAHGADDELGVRGNQIRRAIRSFDDARRSDMTNERMPEFHVHDDNAFPNLQAPSTRPRSHSGSMDDADLEARIRKTLLDNDEGEGDEAERELRELADKLARIRGSTHRPDALKRHGTV
ncbi:Metallo-dependent phosphatase [Fomitiporia mediterranea MF3/22]|uniref:Metallo-dependent phosphatase n=1 Tax=Fomitiporia mediterranea (strain MF3/22) TaxID=694068 RepID=UPI000440923F|nr:Metallo-dependent phosphatase [Fomitiporia mediterranea MF3/22]EJD07740.1 Metallo-dependent phosphatase [Fomitiporia mediterranea MF3/22]